MKGSKDILRASSLQKTHKGSQFIVPIKLCQKVTHFTVLIELYRKSFIAFVPDWTEFENVGSDVTSMTLGSVVVDVRNEKSGVFNDVLSTVDNCCSATTI